MNAYDKLRELLYSDSFDLQVLPRRRLHRTGTTLSVAGGSVDVTDTTGPLSPVLTLKPGDGILFEYAALSFGPASTGTVTCSDAGIFANAGPQVNLFGTRKSRPAAVGTQPSCDMVVETMDLEPYLLSSFDLAAMQGKAGALPDSNSFSFTFLFTFFDSAAVGQNIFWVWNMFFRQVRGLQEN